jgi:hypothetical protein
MTLPNEEMESNLSAVILCTPPNRAALADER